MELKIKRLYRDSIMPIKATEWAAGIDLYANNNSTTEQGLIKWGTGVAVEIPRGFVGLLVPRSSICKTSLMMKNGVGIIDSDYRGELFIQFRYTDFGDLGNAIQYSKGDRIAQLVILPCPHLELVESSILTETLRGEGGFGSTDESRVISSVERPDWY